MSESSGLLNTGSRSTDEEKGKGKRKRAGSDEEDDGEMNHKRDLWASLVLVLARLWGSLSAADVRKELYDIGLEFSSRAARLGRSIQRREINGSADGIGFFVDAIMDAWDHLTSCDGRHAMEEGRLLHCSMRVLNGKGNRFMGEQGKQEDGKALKEAQGLLLLLLDLSPSIETGQAEPELVELESELSELKKLAESQAITIAQQASELARYKEQLEKSAETQIPEDKDESETMQHADSTSGNSTASLSDDTLPMRYSPNPIDEAERSTALPSNETLPEQHSPNPIKGLERSTASLSDDTLPEQHSPAPIEETISESELSRESVSSNLTIIDVYDILRKQYGPDARIEINTATQAPHHKSSVSMTPEGVEERNVAKGEGCSRARGGLLIDGHPVVGIPGFPATMVSNTIKQQSNGTATTQDKALGDLSIEHAQLQEKFNDLQRRCNASIANEEDLTRNTRINHDTRQHYLELLTLAQRDLDNVRCDGLALLKRCEEVVPKHGNDLHRWLQHQQETQSGLPLFHKGREDGRSSQELLSELERVEHGTGYSIDLIPSRKDRLSFPATWVLCESSMELEQCGSGSSLGNFSRQSLHWHLAEMHLAAFSCVFYRIHDTVWDEKKSTVLRARLQESLFLIALGVPKKLRDRYKVIRD